MRQLATLFLRRWASTARISATCSRYSSVYISRFQPYKRHASTNSSSSLKPETSDNDEFKAITTPTTIPVESSTQPSQPASQAAGSGYNPLESIIRAYSRNQTRNPLWTQFLSSLAIYLLADVGAQSFSKKDTDEEQHWDFARTARNLVIGGIASIPGYWWFMYLARNFNYQSSVRSIATKVVVNQIVFAPSFSTYYFGMSCALSGGSPAQILQRIWDTVPTTLVNSLFVWPWFQTFNFTFVQAEMRALTSGMFAIGWQAYLSWLNRYAEKQRNRLQMTGVSEINQLKVVPDNTP